MEWNAPPGMPTPPGCQGDLSPGERTANMAFTGTGRRCTWSPIMHISTTQQISPPFTERRRTGSPVAGKRFCFRAGTGAFPGARNAFRARARRRRHSGERCLYQFPESLQEARRIPVCRSSAEPHSLLRRQRAQSCFQRCGSGPDSHRRSCTRVLWTSTSVPRAAKTPPSARHRRRKAARSRKSSPGAACELEQPGRKGTGEELKYTAPDGKFLADRNRRRAAASH